MANQIVCAIRVNDGIHNLTVVKEGNIKSPIPSGVDITSTDSTSLPSEDGIFYVSSPDPEGPQGIIVDNPNDLGLGFQIQTYDGFFMTFKSKDGEVNNGGGCGGPDNSSCPLHTDATWTHSWETLIFTKVKNASENNSVNPNAVPYYIQARSECYLTSVKGSSNSTSQPVYKSDTGENSVINFIPVVSD